MPPGRFTSTPRASRGSGMQFRMFLYGAIVAWLAWDFLIARGPLYRWCSGTTHATSAPADHPDAVARVDDHFISRADLDAALARHLQQRGLTAATLSRLDLSFARLTARDSLISAHLIQRAAAAAATPEAAWIDSQIAPEITVTEAEARAWFDSHPDERPAPDTTFENSRPTLLATLASVKREAAITRLTSRLRRAATIQYFTDPPKR